MIKKLMLFGGILLFVLISLSMTSAGWWLGSQPDSYYQFNQGVEGENATDLGLNDGSLFHNQTGATTTFNVWDAGQLNNATFANVTDGGNESFWQITDESDFDFDGDSVTIAFWFLSNHGGSNQEVLNKGTSAGGWEFDTSGTSLRFRSPWMSLNTGFNIQDNAWHRVVYTFNNVSDRSEVWIDGVAEGDLSLLGTTDTANSLRIGANEDGVPDWEDSAMDDLQFWKFDWSSDDIAKDFASGNGREATNLSDTLGITDSFFNNETFEVTVEQFIGEVSLTSDILSVVMTLEYNNTNFTTTTLETGLVRNYTTNVVAPGVPADTSIDFVWHLRTVNSTGDIFTESAFADNQLVKDLNIDDCSVNTILLMNLTVVDETDQTVLVGGADNVTINVDLSLGNDLTSDVLPFNQTFAFENSAEICISQDLLGTTNYRLDAEITYESFDRVLEFYHFQNTTLTNETIPQVITLFDLDVLLSQEFLITFKDVSFVPVPDVLVEIQRKYVGEGVFKTVEIPKTDNSGQTIGHMVLSDVVYTIIVSKQGEVLATFEDVIAICQDTSTGQCSINLNAFTSGTQPSDFTDLQGVSFTLTFDDTTNVFTSLFTTTDGSVVTMDLNVTEISDVLTDVCSNSLITSSGTLTCTVPSSFGNTTLRGQLFKDGTFVGEIFVTISDFSPADNFGTTGIILLLIAYITLPMMFITERIGVVIFAIVGFIFAGILGIYSSGAIFGVGSTILWFIVAGGIIIYKISRRKP